VTAQPGRKAQEGIDFRTWPDGDRPPIDWRWSCLHCTTGYATRPRWGRVNARNDARAHVADNHPEALLSAAQRELLQAVRDGSVKGMRHQTMTIDTNTHEPVYGPLVWQYHRTDIRRRNGVTDRVTRLIEAGLAHRVEDGNTCTVAPTEPQPTESTESTAQEGRTTP
jgi:hypothetical protein